MAKGLKSGLTGTLALPKTALCLCFLLFAIASSSSRAGTVLWSEGFENYNTEPGLQYGGLDKNKSASPNAAPNGSGNPWFGPAPNNGWITKAMMNPLPIEETVSPHSGQFMMRGSRNASGWYYGWDNDIDHVNIAYRFHSGAAFTNRFAVDWWFYDALGNTYPGDPDKGPGCFGDHAGLEFSLAAPTATDYSNSGDTGTPSAGTVTARLAIGAYEGATGYDVSVYQVQVQGAADGQFGAGTDQWGTGWFNTGIKRSKGWHHAMITVDGQSMAVLSIDDNIALTHDTGAPNGFNLFTTTELQATPELNNQSAYYDDITLSLITGPTIVRADIKGTTLKLTANDGLVGWTYDVLMSSDPTAPLRQWTSIASKKLSASGPFDITALDAVSPSAPRRFYVLRGAIVK